MIPVILSGGSGSRLWPLSRQSSPKQFLAIYTENTLFQETLIRLRQLKLSAPIIVCNKDHRFTVANNLQDIESEAQEIILEPLGRNTAPAIAVAALTALKKEEDPVLIVLPADHAIENEEALGHSFNIAKKLAEKGYLVTFGVKPNKPHTGYGYIHLGKNLETDAHEISKFIEKPDETTAESFLKEGGYLWNSGMFCFKASSFIEELCKNNPEIVKNAQASIDNAEQDYDFLRLQKDAFKKCENISIDYAVMEKTDKGCVVSIDADWSDIGSWDAVWQVSDKDEANNVVRGDILSENTKNSFLYTDNKLLVTIGVQDLMVINTADAVLVADKEQAQDVKLIVEQLKKSDRVEAKHHSKVDRPWGQFDLLYDAEHSEIKRLTLRPQANISMQKHQMRSEHWIIVEGEARVTLDDKVSDYKKNQSIYIPMNVTHSLENIGDKDLEVIEVRTGGQIDENDVIRVAS